MILIANSCTRWLKISKGLSQKKGKEAQEIFIFFFLKENTCATDLDLFCFKEQTLLTKPVHPMSNDLQRERDNAKENARRY
jgi:hypothetical protein